MKKCQNCANFVWGDMKTRIPQECIVCDFVEAYPSNWKEKPKTNADRIRAMSDEELCDFLYSYKFFEMCKEGCGECSYQGECVRRLAEWLKQIAEE